MFSKQVLLQVYCKMWEIRIFEEWLYQENISGDILGFIYFYIGEEVIVVGVCENLMSVDFIGLIYCGYGYCIVKGCDIYGMMVEIFGKDSGLCCGKGGLMYIVDLLKGMLGVNVIVGGVFFLVIGVVLMVKMLKIGNVGVFFMGDGGFNQGLVFEVINMVVVFQFLVVFIFENNGYGEGIGYDYVVGGCDIVWCVVGFGLLVVIVDGIDFFVVYEVILEVVKCV